MSGSAKDPKLREFSRYLLQFQLDNNVVIRVHRISTEDNGRSDALSRLALLPRSSDEVDASDIRISDAAFESVLSWFGSPFTIDACASMVNRSCRRYISLSACVWDPPVCLNAFCFNFPDFNGGPELIFCHPPRPLIASLWNHFRQCGVKGVMIIPKLQHTQWFAMIMLEAVNLFCFALQGDVDAICWHNSSTPVTDRPLDADLLAVAFDFHSRC